MQHIGGYVCLDVYNRGKHLSLTDDDWLGWPNDDYYYTLYYSCLVLKPQTLT